MLTVLASGEAGGCGRYVDVSPPGALRWGAWRPAPPQPCLDADANGNAYLHTFTCEACMLSATSTLALAFNQSCQSLVLAMAAVDGGGVMSTLVLPTSVSQASSASGSLSSVNWTVSSVLASVLDARARELSLWASVAPVDVVQRWGYVLLPASSSSVGEADGSAWATAGVTPSTPTPPSLTLHITWHLESYYSLVTITDRVSLVTAVTSIVALLGVMNFIYVRNPEKFLVRCGRACCSGSSSKKREVEEVKEVAAPSASQGGGAGGVLSSRALVGGSGAAPEDVAFSARNPMVEQEVRAPVPLHKGGFQTSSILAVIAAAAAQKRAEEAAGGVGGGVGLASEAASSGSSGVGVEERAAPVPVAARQEGSVGSAAEAAPAAAAPEVAEDVTVLPEGWEAFVDEDGHSYFYHAASGVSQWLQPAFDGAGGAAELRKLHLWKIMMQRRLGQQRRGCRRGGSGASQGVLGGRCTMRMTVVPRSGRCQRRSTGLVAMSQRLKKVQNDGHYICVHSLLRGRVFSSSLVRPFHYSVNPPMQQHKPPT